MNDELLKMSTHIYVMQYTTEKLKKSVNMLFPAHEEYIGKHFGEPTPEELKNATCAKY
jgi:hypothetical protein